MKMPRPDELRFGGRWALEMHPADRALPDSHRMVDLDPMRIEPGAREFAFAISTTKTAPRVGADVMMDGERARDRGGPDLHRSERRSAPHHVFHFAWPESHNWFSIRYSRIVSIGSQNPSWR